MLAAAFYLIGKGLHVVDQPRADNLFPVGTPVLTMGFGLVDQRANRSNYLQLRWNNGVI